MKKLTILLCLFLAFAFAEWDVDPGVVHTSLHPLSNTDPLWKSGTQNTLSGAFFSNDLGVCSFDSMYIDSVAVLGNFTEDTNTVDSFYLAMYAARSVITTSIVEDGTDFCGGSAWSVLLHTYPVAAVVIPTDAVFQMKFKPSKESAADKVSIFNVILYGRPK